MISFARTIQATSCLLLALSVFACSTMAVIRSFFFGVRFIYFPSWTPLKRCKDARMAVTNEFTASKVSSGDLRNRKSR